MRGNNQPSTPPPELSRGFRKRCEGRAEAKQHFALLLWNPLEAHPRNAFGSRCHLPRCSPVAGCRLFPSAALSRGAAYRFPFFPRAGAEAPYGAPAVAQGPRRAVFAAGQGAASVRRGPPQAAMMAATGSRSREVASCSGEGEGGGENGSAPLSLAADRRRPAEVA